MDRVTRVRAPRHRRLAGAALLVGALAGVLPAGLVAAWADSPSDQPPIALDEPTGDAPDVPGGVVPANRQAAAPWTVPTMPPECSSTQLTRGDVALCVVGRPGKEPYDFGWGMPPFPDGSASWVWQGWGYNGSPALRTWEQRMVAVNIARPGQSTARVWVQREVAGLFDGFLNEITRRGYSLRDWGAYVFRCEAGSGSRNCSGVTRSSLSYHAYGTAVDFNAAANPHLRYNARDGVTACAQPMRTDIPKWIVDTAQKWGLYWAGYGFGRSCATPTNNASSISRDPMHFEFNGTPELARRILARLTGATTTTTTRPPATTTTTAPPTTSTAPPTASGPFTRSIVAASSWLPADGGSWSYSLSDRDRDGVGDVWAVRPTAAGVEVRVLRGSNPGQLLTQLRLVVDVEEAWRTAVGDHTQDRIADLWVLRAGASGTDLRIYDGTDPRRQVRAATIPLTGAVDSWFLAVRDRNRDGIGDLWAVRPARGGTVEVVVLDGRDPRVALHRSRTWLPTEAAGWNYAIGDRNRDGTPDIWAIRILSTGRVEVRVLDGKNPLRLMERREVPMPLSGTGTWRFTVADRDRDGAIDLWALRSRATNGGTIELRVLSGR